MNRQLMNLVVVVIHWRKTKTGWNWPVDRVAIFLRCSQREGHNFIIFIQIYSDWIGLDILYRNKNACERGLAINNNNNDGMMAIHNCICIEWKDSSEISMQLLRRCSKVFFCFLIRFSASFHFPTYKSISIIIS